MLTIKQNVQEVMKGGNPDRFVKQYEFLDIILELPSDAPAGGPGQEWRTAWGVLNRWPEGQIGAFPVHDDENIVIKDITKWKDYVKAPRVKFSDEEWAPAIEHANKIDRNEQYVAAFVAPGVFEMTHHLMRMENALMNYYEEPEAMQELIEYVTDYEIRWAKEIIDHIHPDAIFHHDDWGSQISSFLSPAMFEEFILPAYKKIYGFYKENGVELIVHHNDAYSANLVPFMIEMGIDIWQGVMSTNNVPELIQKYGDDIIFMGGIDSSKIDKPDWTAEETLSIVEDVCRAAGKKGFIPCNTMGGPDSMYPGAYDAVTEAIKVVSKKMF